MTVRDLMATLQRLPKDVEVLAFEAADASISRQLTAGYIGPGVGLTGEHRFTWRCG